MGEGFRPHSRAARQEINRKGAGARQQRARSQSVNAQSKIEAAPAVYRSIAAVMKDMAAEGISKSRKNQQQNYSFRGIDDVYNALAPILAKHELCLLPRVLSREVTERQTKSGGALFYTVVDVEFDLVSAVDGSTHTIRTVGEAMDSADKSSNKAMSAAYKYAAMQAFCIPTEGDNDADAVTHDVAPRRADTAASAPPAPTITDAQRDMITTMATAAGVSLQKICDTYGIGALPQLSADLYDTVIESLRLTIAKKKPSPQPRAQPATAGDILDDEVPY